MRTEPENSEIHHPVSYTHLDVYKRQLLHVNVPNVPFWYGMQFVVVRFPAPCTNPPEMFVSAVKYPCDIPLTGAPNMSKSFAPGAPGGNCNP